ncbi:MAG: MFS transporter, partial [Caulobacterales bacterium]|nr:MFS transporter [Caulobacterales bacterium]
QMLFNVFGAIASMVTGLLMDRLSLRNVVILSFASAAVGLLALAGAPPAFSISMAVGALVGITMSMTQALLYAVAPSNYPTEMRGTGVGTAVSVGRLGSAARPILAGMLVTSGRTPDDVLSILVPIILVAGVAALALAVLMKRAEAR